MTYDDIFVIHIVDKWNVPNGNQGKSCQQTLYKKKKYKQPGGM